MEDEMIECNVCGLTYQIVWNNDGMGSPTEFCPRCGEANKQRLEKTTIACNH